MSLPHVAVLDDEVDITQLLAGYLQAQGFRVSQVHSGRALLSLMASDPATLVLLDLGLPGEDGFAIARQLREHWRCGLVIVTGRGDAIDKVVGLEIGADDYVTKPYIVPEPAAPVAAPAAATPVERTQLHFAGWTLDTAARRLLDAASHEVVLTTGEFELLQVLARHGGRVLSRDFLLEQTRGREAAPFDRTIDVLIGRLRKKLSDSADEPQLIKSVRGAGYLFVPAVS
ncbi:MAG: response regulator transcription factor [Lysobacteraceae bacterium]|nr:MAG: response regulator transcription factor [Xanthomonadaceae bacterium]